VSRTLFCAWLNSLLYFVYNNGKKITTEKILNIESGIATVIFASVVDTLLCLNCFCEFYKKSQRLASQFLCGWDSLQRKLCLLAGMTGVENTLYVPANVAFKIIYCYILYTIYYIKYIYHIKNSKNQWQNSKYFLIAVCWCENIKIFCFDVLNLFYFVFMFEIFYFVFMFEIF
jgi:hypothetical protein